MIRPGFLSASESLALQAFVRIEREDHGNARLANANPLLDDGKSREYIAELLYLDNRFDLWLALDLPGGWQEGQSIPHDVCSRTGPVRLA